MVNVARIGAVMAVSLALILLSGLLGGICTRQTSEEMQLKIKRIESEMEKGDWENALQHTEELSSLWDEKSKVLQLWVVHEDADEVTVEIGKLKVAAEEGNLLLGKLVCEELRQCTQHLYHRDAPKLKNIF